MNKLLGYYMEAQNSGKPFDATKYSKELDLPLSMVQEVVSTLEKNLAKNLPSYEVPQEDKQYELTGWPVPPPTVRRAFSDSLEESNLFDFDEGPNTLSAFDALTGGLYREDIFAEGIPLFIETLFLEAFDDYRFACTLGNSFFWILFHKGKEWIPLRSYAIEILKLFPYPVGQAYPDPEQFIKAFSLFARKILTTRGICTLKARPKASEVTQGTYLIKGSDAFYSLVEGVNTL